LRMIDSVDGITVAPATPSSARAAISSSGVGAYAVISDAPPNVSAPISNSRFRPIRSPRLPIVISSPASAKPYASTIHSSWGDDGFRSALSSGTARCRTVRSMASSSIARQASATVPHLRAALYVGVSMPPR
jgi:hypothetical protein